MTLFTRFAGRIGRKRFLVGMLALVAVGVVVGVLTTPLQLLAPGGAWTGLVLSLLFLYPALALMVKRLHDRGRPALPFAAIYVLPGLVWNAMQAAGIGFTHVSIGDLRVVEPTGLGLAVTGVTILVALIAFVDLVLLRGEADTNAWGPAPGAGRVGEAASPRRG